MTKLLLDTNFIIGLVVESNEKFDRVQELVNQGIFENDCFVSNLIIQETFTVLGMIAKDMNLVEKTYHMIKDNFIIINEYTIDKFNDKVADIYYKNKGHLSFVDSSLIIVLKEYKFDSIVSFDKDLKNKSNVNVIY